MGCKVGRGKAAWVGRLVGWLAGLGVILASYYGVTSHARR